MLKLVYTPTTEIKESDLVPGSKWRRKSDGAGCVLLRSASAGQIQWCLAHNGDLLWNRGEWQIVQPGSMLTWLSRDFERVGEENTKLGDIEIGHAAIHPSGDVIVVGGDRFEDGQRWIKWTCLKSGHQSSALSDVKFRDLGPIEIDESVKGVG